MPKSSEVNHTVDKLVQKEIVDAYTNKQMTIAQIAKRLELRLGWPDSTARYRVKRILELNKVEIEKYPQFVGT